MPETIRIFLVVACMVLVGAMILLYIGERSDANNNLLHRAFKVFRYGYLKLDACINVGIEYLKNRRRAAYEEEFEKYPIHQSRDQNLSMKARR